jgi:hypothetical protein
VGVLASASLLAVALLGPAPAGAAIPIASTGLSAVPATVLAGARGAFVARFQNDDTSTISQLYFVGSISGATFVAAYPSQGSCSASAASCSLGQVKPGAANAVSVTVVYQTTASATSVGGSFAFNTTGLGSGGGDNSHGDSWPVSASAATSTDPDFGGRFIDDANLVVQNDQAVNDSTNRHATKVIAPNGFIGVTVEDGYVAAQACPPAPYVCTNLFGETSVVSVAAGGTFPGGFRIIMTFDKSELAGVSANTLKIWHTYSGGSEVISAKCSFASGATTPSSMPCLTVKKLPGGDLQVTVWTTHNGSMRGLK